MIFDGKMAHWLEKHCKSGSITRMFQLRDHEFNDLEFLHSIQVKHAARHERSSVVLKKARCRTSLSRGTRMRETNSGLKPLVDRLRVEGEILRRKSSP